MMFNPELQGGGAWERIARQLETAALLRRDQQPSPSFRQSLGYRFIRIGARLAAEPSLNSARSR
jgi:hypothetical protein